ncbi:polysaccharide deacetylase family protein [Chloroflexota bacterium]
MKKDSLVAPIFIVSLDTELLWGYVRYPQDRVAKLLSQDRDKGRGSIDTLLQLFNKYSIPATWAIVGHLFLDHCACEDGMPHKNMPRFRDDWYHCDPCTDIQRNPLYYGADIVQRIMSSDLAHEIGYHSFSHVPFSECSREVAKAEIEKGVELARSLGIALKSFVFPENSINHLDILRDYGFLIYRGANKPERKPGQHFLSWAPVSAFSRILVPPVEPSWKDGIWEIPSSMYFYDQRFPYTLVQRAKNGIRKAIGERKVFHLYLHPENLLMEHSLAEKLDNVLAFVARQRERGNLVVTTMGELASCLAPRQ